MVVDPPLPPETMPLEALQRQYKAAGVANLQPMDMSDPLNKNMQARIDKIYDAYEKRNPDGSPSDKAFYLAIADTFKEVQETYLQFHAKAKSINPLIGESAIYVGDKKYHAQFLKRDEKGNKIILEKTLGLPEAFSPAYAPGQVIFTHALLELIASEGDVHKRKSIIKGVMAHESAHWVNAEGDRELKFVTGLELDRKAPEIASHIHDEILKGTIKPPQANKGDEVATAPIMIPDAAFPFIKQLKTLGVGWLPENNFSPPPYLKKPDDLKPLLLRIKEDNADKTAVMVFLDGDKQPLIDYFEKLQFYSKNVNPAFANGNREAGYLPLAERIAGIRSSDFIPHKNEQHVAPPPATPAGKTVDAGKISTIAPER